MAQLPVNPSIPDVNAPSYIGYSQGTSPIEGNKTIGVALAGLGNILETGANVVDQTVKQRIDEALYNKVDREREGFTGALENLAGIPKDQRIADYQPDSLVSPDTNVPLPISSLERKVNVLKGGLEAGKLHPTDYEGKLNLIAKDLRSQYPGWRDYIDQKIASITGGNPANEYMRNLLQQINQNSTAGKSDRDKALALLDNADVSNMPGLDVIVDKVSTGQVEGNPYAYAIKAVSQWRGAMADIQRRTAIRGDFDGETKTLATMAGQDLDKMADDLIQHSQIVLHGGLGTVGMDKLGQLAQDISTGKVVLSAQEGLQLQQAMHASYNQLYNNIKQQANVGEVRYSSAHGNRNTSISGILTPEEVDKRIKAKMSGFSTVLDLVDNKDYGAAHIVENDNKAILEQSSNDLYNAEDLDVQNYARTAAALSKLGPNVISNTVKDELSEGLVPKIKATVHYQKSKLAAQPDKASGKIYTLQEAIENLKKGGVGIPDPSNPDDKTKKDERAAYESNLNMPSKIADGKTQDVIKKNIIEGTYGPGNETLLSNFADDSRDAKGNYVAGKQSIFANKLYTPAITDSVWNMSKSDPTLWDKYRSSAERNHRSLFTNDIKFINELAQDPNIEFSWDSDKHRLGIKLKDTFFVNPYSSNDPIAETRARQYEDIVARINSGLGVFSEIAKKEGMDVNAHVFRQLTSLGLDPEFTDQNKMLAKQVGGPATFDKIVTAVMSSQNPNQTPMKSLMKFPTIDQLKSKDNLNEIIGGANAAHVSQEWGNPFSPYFKENNLTKITAPNGMSVEVNKKSAEAFQGFLNDLSATGYEIKSLGGYNLREKKGSGGISQHGFGNAIDINPEANPFLQGAKKAKTDLPKNVSELAAKWGLSWGGDWTSVKDAMHFEYTGKMPSRSSINLAGK